MGGKALKAVYVVSSNHIQLFDQLYRSADGAEEADHA